MLQYYHQKKEIRTLTSYMNVIKVASHPFALFFDVDVLELYPDLHVWRRADPPLTAQVGRVASGEVGGRQGLLLGPGYKIASTPGCCL